MVKIFTVMYILCSIYSTNPDIASPAFLQGIAAVEANITPSDAKAEENQIFRLYDCRAIPSTKSGGIGMPLTKKPVQNKFVQVFLLCIDVTSETISSHCTKQLHDLAMMYTFLHDLYKRVILPNCNIATGKFSLESPTLQLSPHVYSQYDTYLSVHCF